MTEPKEGAINRLEPGEYSVVPVFCTERTCIHWDECNPCGEVGLQEKDAGCALICHDYQAAIGPAMDKKVFWARKEIR